MLCSNQLSYVAIEVRDVLSRRRRAFSRFSSGKSRRSRLVIEWIYYACS